MLDELIIGVISGLVATICFSLFLLIVRPKIKISEEICEDPDDVDVYRIKVINKSRVIVNNLKYSLHYCCDAGDGIKEVVEIPTRKDPLTYLDKYSRSSDDYAVRFSYILDKRKYPLEENATLEFSVMANHSISNTMSCVKKTYTKKNIKRGVFETGKSMKIILRGVTKAVENKEKETTTV